jgi:hypothetical protein
MRRIAAIALTSSLLLQAAPLMAAPSLHATRAANTQAAVAAGTINGSVQSAAGQKPANCKVQVRNLENGQLAGTTTSNGGSFSFAGLAPGNYVIEVVDAAGAIAGTSASIPVAAGATVSTTVSANCSEKTPAVAASNGKKISTAVVITSIAAAAGVAGVVALTKPNASPSR